MLIELITQRAVELLSSENSRVRTVKVCKLESITRGIGKFLMALRLNFAVSPRGRLVRTTKPAEEKHCSQSIEFSTPQASIATQERQRRCLHKLFFVTS